MKGGRGGEIWEYIACVVSRNSKLTIKTSKVLIRILSSGLVLPYLSCSLNFLFRSLLMLKVNLRIKSNVLSSQPCSDWEEEVVNKQMGRRIIKAPVWIRGKTAEIVVSTLCLSWHYCHSLRQWGRWTKRRLRQIRPCMSTSQAGILSGYEGHWGRLHFLFAHIICSSSPHATITASPNSE